MPLSVPGRRPHDLSRCGDRAPAEARTSFLSVTRLESYCAPCPAQKNMRSQNGIVHFSSPDGAFTRCRPRVPEGKMLRRCIEFQMRLQCCGSPLPTATLDNVDDVGPSRRDPPEGLFPFLDEESAHVRVWNLDPASSSLLSSHQPRLDCPRPPSRRGASSPSLGSQAQQHGYIQIYFAPASATPPTLHPVLAISPATPLRDGFRTAFPAGHFFFYQSLSVAKRGLLPKHPVAPSTPLQNPRQPCRGRSLALPLWRPRWRGGQHHSRSVQPNLMRYSAPEKGRAAQPTCGEE